jgi:hypothetical protein
VRLAINNNMLVNDASENKAIIAALQPQIPAIKLDKSHRKREYKGTKEMKNKNVTTWYGHISPYLIGPYTTEEEAASETGIF